MPTQARQPASTNIDAPITGPKKYEITFVWPNDDWTWIHVDALDFHQAMLMALDQCPANCRVHKIEAEPAGKSFERKPS